MVTVAYHFGGDEGIIGGLLAFAPRHWVAIGWLVVAMIGVALDRPTVPAAVAALLIAWFGLAGAVWRSPGAPREGERVLRLVTYNTDWHADFAERVSRDLDRWQADVALFQGCSDALVATLHRRPGVQSHAAGEFCMVTRGRILMVDALRGRIDTIPPMLHWEGRTHAIRYRVRFPWGDVDLVSVHLPSPRDALNATLSRDFSLLRSDQRRRDLASANTRAWVQQVAPEAVVAGDFNLPSGSRLFRRHWADRTDAFAAVGRGVGFTMAAGAFRTRIDRVLAGPVARPLAVRVDMGHESEHRPLLVDLAITPSPR
jgi:endonuclease/exonuclease/phosphatase (EEP) superfamily protein YafD